MLVKLKAPYPECFFSDSLHCKYYYALYPLICCTGKNHTGSDLAHKEATKLRLSLSPKKLIVVHQLSVVFKNRVRMCITYHICVINLLCR